MNTHYAKKARRTIRVRARIKRFSDRMRLSVFRSSKHIYAQVIDMTNGKTVVSMSDLELKDKMPKIKAAYEVGRTLAEKATKAGVKEVVFDRGNYKYHGRVKVLCEGAREGKLVI